MFWINKMPTLAVLPLAMLAGTAAYADTLIVRSTGPSAKSYAPGKSLPANAKLSLQAGDAITILDAKGTRVLKGPGSVSVSDASSIPTSSSIVQFLKNTGVRQARTGATRGGLGPVARSPNLWFVDVSKTGNICLSDPAAATMWRPNANAPQTLTLTSVSDSKSMTVQFGVGQSARPWPSSDMPIRDGAQYRLSGAGTNPSTMIKVHAVTSTGDLETTASALLKMGCTAQMDLLIDTVAVPGQTAGSTS
ncbi:MAG: hypothetical protein ACKVOJ_02540 [Sphingomonadaceae bacterium]